MIRVNLLKPRISAVPDTVPAAHQRRKRLAFVSGREASLGVFLLAAGGTAMFVYFGENGAEEIRETAPVAADANPSDRPGGEAERASAPAPASATGDTSQQQTKIAAASEPVAASPDDDPTRVAAVSSAPRTPEDPAGTVATAVNAAPNAAPPSLLLNDLKISNRDGDLKMTLVMSGRPSYNKFHLEKPNRIVIDIVDTRVSLERSHLIRNVDHPLVRRIRLGQFKANPWVTRLVLDVTIFPNLLLFPHSGGLDIQVSRTGQ